MFRPLAAAVLSISACGCETPEVESDPVCDEGPISLVLKNEGLFASGRSWKLEVAPDRTAALTVRDDPENRESTFTVSEKQIAALRAALAAERFFQLDENYGELVPDGSTQTITVTCGDRTRTVRLHFLMNWIRSAPSKLTEPARAVRVWRLVRTWFDDPGAVDLERYDRMVLNAVPGA